MKLFEDNIINNIIMYQVLIILFDTTYADVRCINSGLNIMQLNLQHNYLVMKILVFDDFCIIMSIDTVRINLKIIHIHDEI